MADEVEWTWFYHDVPQALLQQNMQVIQRHIKRLPELVYRLPGIENAMYDFADRPNWVAIVNIGSLPAFIKSVAEKFVEAKTEDVKTLLAPTRGRSRTRRREGAE